MAAMPMKRNTFSQLLQRKNDPQQKQLIICGARQAGKTRLMKGLDQRCHESYIYLNTVPPSPPHMETIPPKHPQNPHCRRVGFGGDFAPGSTGFLRGFS